MTNVKAAMDLCAERRAEAAGLLAQAEKLVFQAQLNLTGGADPVAFAEVKAIAEAMRAARAAIGIGIADWVKA